MWYVIQVFTGREGQVCDLIRQAVGDAATPDGRPLLKELFVPRYQVERKIHGTYETLTRALFPGYVVAITNRVQALNERLHKVPAFTRMLGSESSFVPLDSAEVAFIQAFTSERRRVVRVSKAVAEGDRIVVVEGPMIGREGWIVSVNRRRGTAKVRTEMFGRTMTAEIGIAVMSRRDDEGTCVNEGHHPCGRVGHASVSADDRDEQAASSRVRQTDDLLSVEHPHACGHT